MIIRVFLNSAALGALIACTPGTHTARPVTEAVTAAVDAPPLAPLRTTQPEANPLGTCWAQIRQPATIQTITERAIVQPAQISSTGTITQPPLTRNETRQQVLDDGIRWFAIPCALNTDPAFIETLQRALAARGLYAGPINGLYTPHTRAAVRSYQAARGFDNDTLSLGAARQLGLVSIDLTAAS